MFPKAPKPIEPKHGGSYWAVFLVLGPASPTMSAQTEAWRATKLPISVGQGCHQGAGAPGDDESFVAAYFQSEAFAKKFAAEVQPPPPRVARLKVFCLD